MTGCKDGAVNFKKLYGCDSFFCFNYYSFFFSLFTKRNQRKNLQMNENHSALKTPNVRNLFFFFFLLATEAGEEKHRTETTTRTTLFKGMWFFFSSSKKFIFSRSYWIDCFDSLIDWKMQCLYYNLLVDMWFFLITGSGDEMEESGSFLKSWLWRWFWLRKKKNRRRK